LGLKLSKKEDAEEALLTARLSAFDVSPHAIEQKRRREEQLDEVAQTKARKWELELLEQGGTITADEQAELDKVRKANPEKGHLDLDDPRQMRALTPILTKLVEGSEKLQNAMKAYNNLHYVMALLTIEAIRKQRALEKRQRFR
jgi:hypothetical protein